MKSKKKHLVKFEKRLTIKKNLKSDVTEILIPAFSIRRFLEEEQGGGNKNAVATMEVEDKQSEKMEIVS